MIDVLVIGGGPAGLAAATRLRALGVSNVVVVERETHAGGIPRHSAHTGYGLRDRRRVMTGPAYARAIAEEALSAGADVRTNTMVTGWSEAGNALVTSPVGREELHANAIVLATGARERPRSARLVPGDRPDGVFTTGLLQQLVHLHHQQVGTRAVVVGAELVSWSAVMTLRECGCDVVTMTTEYDRPEVYRAVSFAGSVLAPVMRRARVSRVIGHRRVEAVELEHLDSGKRRVVECDTVVFTGDWIPENELARTRGVNLDVGSLVPIIDAGLRTSEPGVFAIGNLVHPVDTADVAALDGRHVAERVLAHLAGEQVPTPAIPIEAEPPFTWIAPSRFRPGDVRAARNRALLWSVEARRLPRVEVSQDGRVLANRVLGWPLSPGRVFRIPWTMFSGARADAGGIRVRLK